MNSKKMTYPIFKTAKRSKALSSALRLFSVLLVLSLVFAPLQASATPAGGTPSVGFDVPKNVGDSADSVYAVAMGDMDNDGDLDLVSGHSQAAQYELISYENNGSPWSNDWPMHDLRHDSVTTIEDTIYALALGDLDNDGDLDIVTGHGYGEYCELRAWRNDGTPWNDDWSVQNVGSTELAACSNNDTYGRVYSITLADLDQDGDMDIVSSDDQGKIKAWNNDGTPWDAVWNLYQVGSTTGAVYGVTIADFDLDGDLDMVSSGTDEGEDNEIIGWKNEGSPWLSGWFTQQDIASIDASNRAIAAGDLDSDGDPDLVVGSTSSQGLHALQNDGTPFDNTWSIFEIETGIGAVFSVRLGDVDNDHDLDVACGVSSAEDFEVITFQNDSSPWDESWDQRDVAATSTSAVAVELGDLDKDGDLDLAAANLASTDFEVHAWENLLVHRNMPFDNNYVIVQTSDTGSTYGNINQLAVGDLDNDGDDDIVTISEVDSFFDITAWQNDGTPWESTWASQDVISNITNNYGIVLGDLDKDGDLDIIARDWAGKLTAFENTSTRWSQAWPSYDLATGLANVYTLAIGDLDNDGDLDLITSLYGVNRPLVGWENDGTPWNDTWDSYDLGYANDEIMALAVGDLDRDGWLDLVTGCYPGEDYELIAWRNDGSPWTGLFSSNDIGATNSYVNGIKVGDLDLDGYLDVISIHDSGSWPDHTGNVTAWENDSTPFSSLWSSNSIAQHPKGFNSLDIGDLDRDKDIDVITGAGGLTDYDLFTYENDGSPFTDSWSGVHLGTTHYQNSNQVVAADLDKQGDLDLVESGQVHNQVFGIVRIWKNIGGSAFLSAEDVAPLSSLSHGEETAYYKVVFKHNGKSNDLDLELNSFEPHLLGADCSTALTNNEAQNQIEFLRVRLDDGDDTFETDGSDVQVANVSTMNVVSGEQAVPFTDGDANAKLSGGGGGGRTFWISLKAKIAADICMRYDPDEDSLVDAHRTWTTPMSDFFSSIQDTSEVTAGAVSFTNIAPEISESDPQAVTMSEDGAPTPFDLTLNATDSDGDALTWSIKTQATNGIAAATGIGASKVISYTPKTNWSGDDSFEVKVQDGSGETDSITVNVTVEAVNDAPLFSQTSPVGVTMSEDGSPTAFSLTLNASDAEGDTITWSISSQGTNGDASASGTGTSKDIGYTPDPNFTGQDSFQVQASDGNGGDSYITVNVTVQSVNDAPVMDTSGTVNLDAILENSFNNSGTLISDILSRLGGSKITDPDEGALQGIAVIFADTSQGQWQYSTNSGGSWNALGTVSASSARLLAANPATRLRFVPAQGYTGSLAPAISFHAWDQTSGSNGSSANTSPNGGSTAFSIQTEDASLVVNPLQKIFLPLVRK